MANYAGAEFAALNETLTFPDGTMELTQCIEVELLLDNVSEPQMLLSDIFTATATFQGKSSDVTLGQVIAFDAENSGMFLYL